MEIIYPQSPVFYVALASGIILIFSLLFFFFLKRKKGRLKSSLDMSLFSIQLPKYEDRAKKKKTLKQ